MTIEQEYLLQLIKSIINSENIPMPPQKLCMKSFLGYATENQFDHIIYPQFKDLNIHDESDPIMHSFHQKYGRAVVRDQMQDMDLQEVCDLLSEANITHVPLKGTVIKKYYPFPDIRRSGDIDILVPISDIERVNKIMLGIGYVCENDIHHDHYVYRRNKTIIEIHKYLVSEDDIGTDFCNCVWTNLNGEGYCKEMDPEFLYTYLLVHLRRHLLEAGGGGIKLILDLWVLNRKMIFDQDKLKSFLEQAHITNLCAYAEALSRKWFGGEACTDEDVLFLENLILNSGAYGNYSTYLDMRLSRNSSKGFALNKVSNFIKLLFPKLSTMKHKYPILNKYPVLLPLSWIRRIFDAKKEHTKAVARSIGSLSNEEAKKLEHFCDSIEK